MMKSIVAGTALVGLVLAAGPASAQQPVSKQEVQSFFQKAQQELTQVVKAGDVDRLTKLVREYVADGATFAVSMEVMAGDRRKAFTTVSLDKQDIIRFQRIVLTTLEMRDAIQDYELRIEVAEVNPIGADTALVRTRINDSGSLRAPADVTGAIQPGGQPGTQQAGQALRFERTVTCNQMLRREGQDRFVIGISNCEGQARL
ncbi:MAG TPA: hypothetical protein VM434_20310 [Beijerinckiaceae bacterium]|nr:hypothetical protein [Beijerinckiaceae bacterium]